MKRFAVGGLLHEKAPVVDGFDVILNNQTFRYNTDHEIIGLMLQNLTGVMNS